MLTVMLSFAFKELAPFGGRSIISMDGFSQYYPMLMNMTEAIRNGELSRKRWESYQKLVKEAKYTDDKDGFLRARQQRNKAIAKFSREQKKAGKIRR